MDKQEVFILMEDDYGGMFSSPALPIGIAVTSEEDAKKFVVSRSVCRRSYEKVVVFDNIAEGIKHLYPDINVDKYLSKKS